jgi:hypothetical protein
MHVCTCNVAAHYTYQREKHSGICAAEGHRCCCCCWPRWRHRGVSLSFSYFSPDFTDFTTDLTARCCARLVFAAVFHFRTLYIHTYIGVCVCVCVYCIFSHFSPDVTDLTRCARLVFFAAVFHFHTLYTYTHTNIYIHTYTYT